MFEAGVLGADDVLFPVELGMEGGGGMYLMGLNIIRQVEPKRENVNLRLARNGNVVRH